MSDDIWWKVDTIREHVKSLERIENMEVAKMLYIQDIKFLLFVIDILTNNGGDMTTERNK